MPRSHLVIAALLVGAPGLALAQDGGPVNLDLERGTPGEVPDGWSLTRSAETTSYHATLVEEGARSGTRCARLEGGRAGDESFGTLAQWVDAVPLRRRHLVLRAAVRAELAAGARAQLWMRIDRRGGAVASFDSTADRPVADGEWRTVALSADVPGDAEQLVFGLILVGRGRAWLDDVSLELLRPPPDPPEGPRPLTRRGRENLTAATRLLGALRYFHPSDQAAAARWDDVAVRAVRTAESAHGPASLARRLQAAFAPVAPTLVVTVADRRAPRAPRVLRGARGRGIAVVAWRHRGVDLGAPGPWRSERVRVPAPDGVLPVGAPDPRAPLVLDLGAGVRALVPVALWADEGGTLPHPRPPRRARPRPAADGGAGPGGHDGARDGGERRAGDDERDAVAVDPEAEAIAALPLHHVAEDRATRLATVALAWSTLAQFHPSLEAADARTRWEAALAPALEAAAVAPSAAELEPALRRLVAALGDGQADVIRAGGGPVDASRPPIGWAWIEDRLVVTRVERRAAGLRPGDVVAAIDGRPVAEALAAAEALVSGATPQGLRARALLALATGPRDSELVLTIARRAGGGGAAPATADVRVRRSAPLFPWQPDARPPAVHRTAGGAYYVDLTRAGDAELAAALPRLAAAGALVLDLRGELRASPSFLGHLIARPVELAGWEPPSFGRPGPPDAPPGPRATTVAPRAPRLGARVVFLADGRTTGRAEALLAAAARARLGPVVGAATAGASGAPNELALPGGAGLVFSGTRPGERVEPTAPAAPTIAGVAAGRDEVLERALGLVAR